ncbi:MAG: hypothetical protein HOP36_02240 [Methyloglobulus sp.]|nr:hypothetical protein [Methyloglobulus sp.]
MAVALSFCRLFGQEVLKTSFRKNSDSPLENTAFENIEPEFLIYTLSLDGKYQSEIKERLSELNSS